MSFLLEWKRAKRQENNNKINNIPKTLEISSFVEFDLQKLLHAVVDDESNVDDLSRKNEVVVALFKFQKLDSAEFLRSYHATSSWEFRDELDDAEEIDVRIVDGEVDEKRAGASINPEILLQVVENLSCFRFVSENKIMRFNSTHRPSSFV